MASRMGRQRSALPSLYYEGYLEKRANEKDKMSVKLWTCLCGNSLFFFNNSNDVDYMEKLDLVGFVSTKDDGSRDKKLDAARFILCLKDKNIKLTAPSLEARELWKGFIHSVVELSVPKSLNLLPGQLETLKEAVEKEEERLKARPASVVPALDQRVSGVEGDLPACYHDKLSRLEAEVLLEREPERGNLLLRPGGHGSSFAMTTREVLDRSIFKHYQVIQEPGEGFYIALQKPIHCATLQDVVDLMVKETAGLMRPFLADKQYEDVLSFIKSNEESGEKTVVHVSPNPAPPIPAPRKGLRGGTSLDSSVVDTGAYMTADAVKGPYENHKMNDECSRLCHTPPPVPAPKPAAAPGSHDKAVQVGRPNITPPLPPTASKPAEMKARARVALMPKSFQSDVSQGGREAEEKEAGQSRAGPSPGPAPHGLPGSAFFRTGCNRSQSDVCGMTEELKLKLAEKRLLCQD